MFFRLEKFQKLFSDLIQTHIFHYLHLRKIKSALILVRDESTRGTTLVIAAAITFNVLSDISRLFLLAFKKGAQKLLHRVTSRPSSFQPLSIEELSDYYSSS